MKKGQKWTRSCTIHDYLKKSVQHWLKQEQVDLKIYEIHISVLAWGQTGQWNLLACQFDFLENFVFLSIKLKRSYNAIFAPLFDGGKNRKIWHKVFEKTRTGKPLASLRFLKRSWPHGKTIYVTRSLSKRTI